MKINENHWLLTKPVAHRGLHDEENPENSLGAFRKAVERGYPIELDVRITRDGEPFILHDDNIERVTGIRGKAAELRKADLEKLMIRGTRFSIPTLDQVLKTVAGRVPILIEIKNGGLPGKLEKSIHERLRIYNGPYVIESFDPLSLLYMKIRDKRYIIGQLSYLFEKQHYPDSVKAILRDCRSNIFVRPDFIAYDIKALPRERITDLREKGTPVIGWTVKTEEDLFIAKKYCDNYIFENIRP